MGRTLSVSSLNSNGVSSTGGNPNKPYDIKRLVSNATVAMLQETHLSKDDGMLPLDAIFPPQAYELDYCHGSGSSAGLCTATPLGSSRICHESPIFLSSFCNITEPINFSGYFINVYFHKPDKHSIKSLVQYLQSLPLEENVIVMGDFNLSPSPSHATHKLFGKLEQSLRQLYITHLPTAFPTHHNRNSQCMPSFIDHIFLRVPGYLKASNTVTHTKFDHDLVTLYLTESDGSGPPVQQRSKAYNDVNFPKFLMDWHAIQPLPHTYPEFVSKLESLAVKYLAHYKKPSKNAPLFLFALLHALQARDMQRWNNIAMNNGCPELTVGTIKDLLSSHSKLTQLFFLSNSPYYVSDPNVKRWYLEYLRKMVPPTKASNLTAIHPDEKSPPTSDRAEMAKLIETTWAPVFSKREPEYNLEEFLDRIGHLLPDYSNFTVDLSDGAIEKSVSGLPTESAPGPDGITYTLIKQALPVFMPVIRSIYSLMSSGPGFVIQYEICENEIRE